MSQTSLMKPAGSSIRSAFAFRYFVLSGLFLVACHAMQGQAPSPLFSDVHSADTTHVWEGGIGSDPVAAGDLVYITVAGSTDLTRTYRISPNGEVAMPILKSGVHIAGLTPPQMAEAVSQALIEERILVKPIVSAEVVEYRSRLVSVVGSVKSPVILQAIGNTTLLDAIARAQGLAPEAGPDIIVSRTVAPNTLASNTVEPNTLGPKKSTEVIHISAKALFAGSDPALNLALHGGEEIRVPEASKLYIMGNVRTPGVFPLNELDGSTVLKALALSQGTLSFTAKKAYVYRVTAGSAARQEITVELVQILHRKAPDVALQANDILYIPENSRMRLSAAVLDHLSGFGASTATGLIVYR